ncbi:L,D-transpeptidase family protein [Methylomicrobium sp. RS1]|jgi:murein L,D-transpeptidase YafK|uniref:L,D-transpeptidase family protein n=1 Tax=Candidatus Methylomicrobium oryzae TaxID=2802053 RepID=UPI0019218872|nr:L,D-transpeptidase [Methylomicrobium sp. RS1]MBL1262203.1 L,D-transpeptidase [Methylomicrobium sp. RS1]
MLRICLWLLNVFFAGVAVAGEDFWLLVDTEALKIEVKKGEKTVDTIDNIAIGRGGAGYKAHRGDDITPYGDYRIGWVGQRSNFRRFFGLTYPNTQDARTALIKGIITKQTYERIVEANESHGIPPQNTPLGGQIGIHGLGAADEKIHRSMNWTHGCIAMTNTQIDHLSRYVEPGMVVKIK